MKNVVLITGSEGGIGKATVSVFREAGWYVIGADRYRGEVPSLCDRFVQVDLSIHLDCERVFSEIAAQEGRIHALINNAAVQLCKPLVETTPEEWDQVMNTNLRAPYLCVRSAHPLMRGRGAAIVNISSVHALATSTNMAAYASSKGALVSLTRALAIELANDGIRVNAVLPGAVDTDMLRAGLSRDHVQGNNEQMKLQRLAEKTVMGRVARPDEIAQMILFLAEKDRSSFITGQTFVVDGGALSKLSTE